MPCLHIADTFMVAASAVGESFVVTLFWPQFMGSGDVAYGTCNRVIFRHGPEPFAQVSRQLLIMCTAEV